MSINSKKEAKNSSYGNQESLQAIVFADDFIHELKPSEAVYPSILLPIVTAPLFDYLLETLVRSRVQQVFLYCSSHVEKLKEFIDLKKHFQDENLIITPIFSDGCRSLGDALRDIDTKGCIRGDFILIRGTAFANVDLRTLMDLHKLRKEKDKNTAMTMILRNLGNIKDSALKSESSLVVSNANTRKLLHYKKFAQNEKKIDLELQWFLEHDKIHIDTALFDTRIYMCSQSVLPLFADNFDFQTMEDFIRGVLINEEFLDSRIYWEPLASPTYALPISSWKAYQILCRDILQRQCYPLAPDTLPLSLRYFIYMSRSTYKHHAATLSKGCTLHSESIVGENSTLGENSFIQRSVIGSNCTIGINVQINNSYIISNSLIKDDSVINNSIVFPNCTLEKGTKLNASILAPNVTCKGDHVNEFIRIDNDGNVVIKKKELHLDDNDNDFSTVLAEDDCDEDSDCDASSTSSISSAWSSPSSRDSALPPVLQDDNEMFLSEVVDSLLRGYQDKLKCENLILEVNSSRYAYNVSIRQVSYNVIKAILSLPSLHYTSTINNSSNLNLQSVEYQRILKAMLNYFKPIISNYIKTENAQEDCLRAIEDVAYTNQDFIVLYAQNLLHFFYDNEILSEEKIMEWFEQDCNGDNDGMDEYYNNVDDVKQQESKQNVAKAIRAAVLPFVNWLKEAEEDSSDSS
ncbi:hypothetical protein TSAR_014881 [Trichomalopsis sarcophagae]|uniref:Translation initiation factor eIF2B subunit epsilon n=1 Tax=Trichomalopsis sarcophagae TaxID=543379 RepID=A0A232EYH0_9HYME|nr:hypothetical protein TSAR_014881 [Trichomalopsis sarcophagae]